MALPIPNEGRFLLSVPYAAEGVTRVEVPGLHSPLDLLTAAVSCLSINESTTSTSPAPDNAKEYTDVSESYRPLDILESNRSTSEIPDSLSEDDHSGASVLPLDEVDDDLDSTGTPHAYSSPGRRRSSDLPSADSSMEKRPTSSPWTTRLQRKLYKTNGSIFWFQSEGEDVLSAPPACESGLVHCGDFYLHSTPVENQIWRCESSPAGKLLWKESTLGEEQVIVKGIRRVIVVTHDKALSAIKKTTYLRYHQK